MTRAARLRLWLSYQRYAFVLLAATGALLALPLALRPGPRWAWLTLAIICGLVGLKLGAFAVLVWTRFPKKMRATRVALHRIERGRFRAESVIPYCGDPCFRVVAREILTRAGVAPAQRRQLMPRFAAEARRRGDFVLFVDRENGVVVKVGPH